MPSDDPASDSPSSKHATFLREASSQAASRIAANWKEVSQELESRGRERGNALAAVARLDNALQAALRTKMIDDEKAVAAMFSENGSLFPFGAKVRMGYVLGLYDRVIYDDLIRVNKIRNAFAHKEEAKDFSWDSIRDTTKNIRVFDYFKTLSGFDYFDVLLGGAKDAGLNPTGDLSLGAKFEHAILLLMSFTRRNANSGTDHS